MDINTIQQKLHYTFEDEALLRLAFTHSSYANEHRTQSNEKLEFLGDSILNFCIADYLFRRGGRDEGFFTVTRAKIVSEAPLADCVDRMGIIGYLQCGVGEQRNENKSDAVKAYLFEAVIGAVYLDSGDIQTAEKFILRHLDFVIRETVPEKGVKFNIKARLVDNDPTGAEKPSKADAVKTKKPVEKPVQNKPAEKPAAEKADPKKAKKEEKQAKKQEKVKKKQEEKQRKEQGKSVPKKDAPAQIKTDYKGLLASYVQKKGSKIDYKTLEQSGPAHEPFFKVAAYVDNQQRGFGEGSRVRDAEQAAAHEACVFFGIGQ